MMKLTVKRFKVKDILINSGFKKTSPQATITSVFSQLRSSHDAVFGFEGKKFLGMINLYYSFLKKRPPSSAKVVNCLYHPPKLNQEMLIPEAARLMVESRVYYLPVFNEKEEFVGVTSALKILRWFLNQPLVNSSTGELFTPKPPLYISLKEGIGRARNLMVAKKVSRLLVVDRERRLVGIVSSYDLREPFTSPMETLHFLSRSPIKKGVADIPVERFVKRNLVTVSEKEPLRSVIKSILREGVGSVIVFDHQALGLVTIRDLLKLIWQVYGEARRGEVELTAHQSLSSANRQLIASRVRKMILGQSFLASRVKDVRLVFDWLAKKSVRRPLLKIRALVTTDRNQTLHIKARGRKIVSVISQLMGRLRRRLEKH